MKATIYQTPIKDLNKLCETWDLEVEAFTKPIEMQNPTLPPFILTNKTRGNTK